MVKDLAKGGGTWHVLAATLDAHEADTLREHEAGT